MDALANIALLYTDCDDAAYAPLSRRPSTPSTQREETLSVQLHSGSPPDQETLAAWVPNGRSGRILTIAGSGRTRVYAGMPNVGGSTNAGSIIIAGSTIYDNNSAALEAIMQVWTFSRPLLPSGSPACRDRDNGDAQQANDSADQHDDLRVAGPEVMSKRG